MLHTQFVQQMGSLRPELRVDIGLLLYLGINFSYIAVVYHHKLIINITVL